MADNAIIKILTALLKHHVKKVVGDETLGVIGQEIAAIGGDKVDEQIKSWLGEATNAEELENAARYAYDAQQLRPAGGGCAFVFGAVCLGAGEG